MTDWQDHIHSNPEILTGKPVVKGTRLAVDFILGLFASGWTDQQVLESYPTLTPQSLQAVFSFAAECIQQKAIITPSTQGKRYKYIVSPRLAHPAQVKDFELEIFEEMIVETHG